MVGGGQPTFAPLLYKELIQLPEYQTPEQRQALMRRIRETLFKLIVIVGVCKPLEAIFDIDAITKPEDKDYTFSRCADTSFFFKQKIWSPVSNDSTEKGGSAMKRIPGVALRGKAACTSTIRKASTMCWHHRRTLVCGIPARRSLSVEINEYS